MLFAWASSRVGGFIVCRCEHTETTRKWMKCWFAHSKREPTAQSQLNKGRRKLLTNRDVCLSLSSRPDPDHIEKWKSMNWQKLNFLIVSAVVKLIALNKYTRREIYDIDRVSHRLSRRWYKLNFTSQWPEYVCWGRKALDRAKKKGVKSGNANEMEERENVERALFRYEFECYTSTKYFLIIITTHRLSCCLGGGWKTRSISHEGCSRVVNSPRDITQREELRKFK